MHYKNGRKAVAGDKVVQVGSQVATGIIHSLNPGTTTCNGRLAISTPSDPYVNLSECLHADDVAAATIPDTSAK